MKMTILLLSLFLIPTLAFCQQKEDSRIIITLKDTTDLYNKVKAALVKKEFIVKEDMNQDTLSTYPRQLRTRPGFAIVNAVINNNTVTLTGHYSLKTGDVHGNGRLPVHYSRILYFKNSKLWKLLLMIVDEMEDKEKISYSK